MYIQPINEVSVTSGLDVSTLKQSSSGQCRTYTRYDISVHSLLHWPDDGCFTVETSSPDVTDISLMG